MAKKVKRPVESESYAADHSDLPSDDDLSEHDEGDKDSTASSSNAEENDNEDESEDASSSSVEREDDEEEESPSGDQGFNMADPSLSSGEACTFDLRNLVAINSHQVSSASLYKSSKKQIEQDITIPPENLGVIVDEELLLEKASEGCTQLLGALWKLPIERSDAGPMVTLPGYFEMKIPRALPPPPPKKETKWEKFAKDRGIDVNQEKRSRKVWDEVSKTWMYRHGYQKANNDSSAWPIMEVKKNDDPYADPWETLRDAKRTRVEKNTENRMRNEERAGALPKGTATRVLKNSKRVRESGKTGGNLDRVPTGVPVDLETRKGAPVKSLQRGRDSTVAALAATQRSTASLGKFDRMREGEPERKKALAGLKKRKFESATDRKVVSSEAERGMKLLTSVMTGGGVAREKAKRAGKLAKGETAYDYDFDDGLGPGKFKKKKGRAGAGKQKKLTKKRIK